jgi:hypothetical protein
MKNDYMKEIKMNKNDFIKMRNEIDRLSSVLINEFGGPDDSGSACDMAIKILRQAARNDLSIKAENITLRLNTTFVCSKCGIPYLECDKDECNDSGEHSRCCGEPRLESGKWIQRNIQDECYNH